MIFGFFDRVVSRWQAALIFGLLTIRSSCWKLSYQKLGLWEFELLMIKPLEVEPS